MLSILQHKCHKKKYSFFNFAQNTVIYYHITHTIDILLYHNPGMMYCIES